MSELSPAARKRLKARAHALAPLVLIGGKGVTPRVLAEIERALAAHELIKLRAAGLARDQRQAAMLQICAATGAQPVQHIGKMLVLFREKPPDPDAPPDESRDSERREARSASPRPESAPRPSRRHTSRSARARSAS